MIHNCLAFGQLTHSARAKAGTEAMPYQLTSAASALIFKSNRTRAPNQIHQTNQLQTPSCSQHSICHAGTLHLQHIPHREPPETEPEFALFLSGDSNNQSTAPNLHFATLTFAKTAILTSKLEKPPTGFIAWSASAKISVLATSPLSALHLSGTSDAELCRANTGSMQWC